MTMQASTRIPPRTHPTTSAVSLDLEAVAGGDALLADFELLRLSVEESTTEDMLLDTSEVGGVVD